MAKQKKRDRRVKSRSNQRPTRSRSSYTLPSWSYDLIALSGLLGAVVIFFWPVLSEQGYLWEDIPEQWYPLASYAASELRMGRLPLWNPYMFGGIPFFPMIDVAVLYPLNWVFILFVDNMMLSFLVVEYHIIAHVFLIGTAVYIFCRSISLNHSAAFIGALIYMLCGMTVHNVFHREFIFGLTWFPVVFMMFIRTIERSSFLLALATGGLLGILITGGHAQVFVYVSYTLGLYTLYCMVERIRTSGMHSSLLRLAGVAAVVMITGICLAAAILLPTFELIDHALRPEVTYEVATTYARHPQELITLLMPDFYGRMEPLDWNYWGPWGSEYGHFWEAHAYSGILPLLLTGIAIALRRTRLTIFLVILAVLSFILSLGASTPIHGIAYELIPGFDRFRAPARFSLLFSFSIAVLSGIAVDALRQLQEEEQRLVGLCLKIYGGVFLLGALVYMIAEGPIIVWLTAGQADLQSLAQEAMNTHSGTFIIFFFTSMGMCLAWRQLRGWHSVLVSLSITLIFIDLALSGYSFNAHTKGPNAYYPRSNLITFLEEQQANNGGRARTRQAQSLLMTRNAGLIYRIHTLEGYASPLRLSITTPPRYLDELMNVQYRIQVGENGEDVSLVPNPDTMPQAFVVRNFVIAENRDAVAEAMADSAFDFRTTVTLDRPPSLDIKPETSSAAERPVVTHFEPNNMTVTVDMETPGILVIGEVYYPAWQAYVDGRPEQIFRANDTMRAIPLPAGSHTVELKYESSMLRIGAVISCITLLIILGALGIMWRQRSS